MNTAHLWERARWAQPPEYWRPPRWRFSLSCLQPFQLRRQVRAFLFRPTKKGEKVAILRRRVGKVEELPFRNNKHNLSPGHLNECEFTSMWIHMAWVHNAWRKKYSGRYYLDVHLPLHSNQTLGLVETKRVTDLPPVLAIADKFGWSPRIGIPVDWTHLVPESITHWYTVPRTAAAGG